MSVTTTYDHETLEALLWEPGADGGVVCNLCAHRCRVRPGLRGICGVRENRHGRLVTRADRVAAADIDPIEKKPLFHFLPGSRAYSIATIGCNFHCLFCQNWSISQWPRAHPEPQLPGEAVSPRQIVDAAISTGSSSIAYTYTEPTIFFELALATSQLAVASGLRNVFITNGYMSPEALALIGPVLHAANVDLKSFSDRFYRKICGATLGPVLATIEALRERRIWVEITTLVIPGQNDSDAELETLARWLAHVDRDMPWHVSAFFPAYRWTHVPSTPATTLHRAAAIGRAAGLRYVYAGNIPMEVAEPDTACPRCSRCLVQRRVFAVIKNEIRDGRCPGCETRIPGVWN